MAQISTAPAKALTIAEVLQSLFGNSCLSQKPQFLHWPPDVFAFAAFLLGQSGAYIKVVNDWPPRRAQLEKWRHWIEELGTQWRTDATKKRWPSQIELWWNEVKSNSALSVSSIPSRRRLWEALLQLCSAADVACAGVGVPDFEQKRDNFSYETTFMLLNCMYQRLPSSLCKQIHPSRLLVLPKMHTPQKGITLRSLTHNIALCSGSDVTPTWCEVPEIFQRRATMRFPHSMTLLIVPFPFHISPRQFIPSHKPEGKLRGMAKDFGFFDFVPTPLPPKFFSRLKAMCERTIDVVGRLDGVLFPELSMRNQEFDRLRKVLLPYVDFFVGGVCEPGKNGSNGENYVRICIKIAGRFFELQQHKHHRWYLDDPQIHQYGLGATLDPNRKWWENTLVPKRTIKFIALDSYVTFTVLVCEDIARPDPIGNILRAVGPNLLLAVLQDGPQLATRWSSRCATVLADDPGTSVLTLTSCGMAEMCRPPGTSACRIVALWKDRDSDAREITLPPGADAVALCLTKKPDKEWSADGRNDKMSAGLLKLSGIHPIRASAV